MADDRSGSGEASEDGKMGMEMKMEDKSEYRESLLVYEVRWVRLILNARQEGFLENLMIQGLKNSR